MSESFSFIAGNISGYFSYCECDGGVGGDFCDIDVRNECEVDPCGNRTHFVGGVVVNRSFQCVDRLGYYECIETRTSESTTRSPFVDKESQGTSTVTVIGVGLASLFVIALLVVLVIKGSRGTKTVVKKTFYPAGWLEIIKGSFGRKRRRDDPAGNYEMG